MEKELQQGVTLKDAGGDGSKMRITKKKLDNLSIVTGQYMVINSDEKLKRMKQMLQLMVSMTVICWIGVAKAETKRQTARSS